MSAWLCSLVNGLKHQRVAVLSAILSSLMLSLFSLNAYANEQDPNINSDISKANSVASHVSSDALPIGSKATYVGSEACVDCHSAEVEAWEGSHHDMAMKHATDESVLGDFNDQTVTHDGKPNRFFARAKSSGSISKGQTANSKITKSAIPLPLNHYNNTWLNLKTAVYS